MNTTIQQLCQSAYANALVKGFHDKPREFGTAIALIHSELSEALEADREGKHRKVTFQEYTSLMEQSDEQFIDSFKEHFRGSVLEELVDVFIRLGDTIGELKLETSVEYMLDLKMRYNYLRQPKHGKEY